MTHKRLTKKLLIQLSILLIAMILLASCAQTSTDNGPELPSSANETEESGGATPTNI